AFTSRISTRLIFVYLKTSSPSHIAPSPATRTRSERAKESRHRQLNEHGRRSAAGCGVDATHLRSVNPDGDRGCVVHLVGLGQLPAWIGLQIETEHIAVHPSRKPEPLSVE